MDDNLNHLGKVVCWLVAEPKKICPPCNSWKLCMLPYLEKRDFADAVKLKSSQRGDHHKLSMCTLSPVTSVLMRDPEVRRHRREDDMKTEAEVVVTTNQGTQED
jgi:hypothetical protein